MSVAVHDLRNPIAVIRASAQMARRQVDRGDVDAARARIASIVDQADRATRMLETFQDAAFIEGGHLPLKPEPVDLGEIVAAAVEISRRSTPDLVDRPFQTNVPAPCLGRWDRLRLQRAIAALLDNALIYGDQSQPVRLEASCTPALVLVCVSGGGAGPDRAEADRLFGRFYRGRAASEAGRGGSGLGLFIARGIARAHGGDVRLQPGGPADAFVLELPLEPAPSA